MDFDRLLAEGVISPATRAWIEPLWQEEQDTAQLLREEAAQYRLFGGDEEENNSECTDDLIEDHVITVDGMSFPYLLDDQSTGHGNRVWHASIATSLYISKLLLSSQNSPIRQSSSFQSLELGAGTAIPSIYLAQLMTVSKLPDTVRPLIHITDGKQYRNIRQILQSVDRQSSMVRTTVQFRVSPHNWGEGVGKDNNNNSNNNKSFFFQEECLPTNTSNQYDFVIVSDCIYNPTYHSALLDSIAAFLKLPTSSSSSSFEGDDSAINGGGGGRAIVSFSLHGNTSDDTVWNFLKLADNKTSADQQWKLQVQPAAELVDLDPHDGVAMERMERGGWNMEGKMKQLGLWADNMEGKRWIAYLYEFTWIGIAP